VFAVLSFEDFDFGNICIFKKKKDLKIEALEKLLELNRLTKQGMIIT